MESANVVPGGILKDQRLVMKSKLSRELGYHMYITIEGKWCSAPAGNHVIATSGVSGDCGTVVGLFPSFHILAACSASSIAYAGSLSSLHRRL